MNKNGSFLDYLEPVQESSQVQKSNSGQSFESFLQPIKEEQKITPKERISQIGKETAKLATVPLSRALEGISGIVGGAIETPSALVSTAYEALGKEAPEWTQGPSPIRVSNIGEIIPALRTPQEIREQETAPRFGEYTEPMTGPEKILSSAGEIGTSLATGGIKNPKQLLKGTGAALATRKAIEYSDLPPFFSLPAETLATHGAISKSTPSLTRQASTEKGLKLAETSEKEGITTAPAGILKTGKPNAHLTRFLQWTGRSGEKIRNQAQEFVGQVEEAYHNILSDIHNPYKTERNIEILQKQANKLFDPVKDLANKNPVPLNRQNLINSVEKNINKIKKSKSLYPGEKQALSILEDFKKELSGEFNLDNAEATYRSFNKHISDWDSPTKRDIHLMDVKHSIKKEMLNAGKSVPDFNQAFELSNIAYHNVANLREATELLKTSFTPTGQFDPKKFIETARNKEKRSTLEGLLGKQNVTRLMNLADLTESAVKNFKEVGALLPEDLKESNKMISSLISIFGHTAEAVTTLAGSKIAANILINPNLQKNYIGYLRSIRDNSPKMAAYYIRNIKKESPELFQQDTEE